MADKGLDQLIKDWAQAKQSYCKEWIRIYEQEGYKNIGTVDKAAGTTTQALALDILEKQLECKMRYEKNN